MIWRTAQSRPLGTQRAVIIGYEAMVDWWLSDENRDIFVETPASVPHRQSRSHPGLSPILRDEKQASNLLSLPHILLHTCSCTLKFQSSRELFNRTGGYFMQNTTNILGGEEISTVSSDGKRTFIRWEAFERETPEFARPQTTFRANWKLQLLCLPIFLYGLPADCVTGGHRLSCIRNGKFRCPWHYLLCPRDV
jgi:hypothetical protein